MSIKVFISYVWEESNFTDKLVNLIGRDIAVLDKYSFERSTKLDKEIEDYLLRSPIVVSLFSAAALDAPYIQFELQIIQQLIKEGTIRHYKPFIIDEKVQIEDIRLRYPWVLNYQLERTYSPIFIDRIVDQFITELKWEVNPALKARSDSIMVRLEDLAKIRAGYYTSNSAEKKAIIISGFPNGIGRTKLLREFLLGDINPNKPKTYNPPVLMLKSGESIEEFIVFLNDWLLEYDEQALLDVLSGTKQDKTSIAVKLMNSLANKNERIFIKDEDCILLYDGKFNSWIKEIINSPDLSNQLHLFIASNHFLKKEEKDNFKKVINIVIQPLAKNEKAILFNSYANKRDVSLSQIQADGFLQKLPGIPEIVFNFVDLIKDESIDFAEKNIYIVIKSADEKIKLLLSQFKSKDYIDLLVLLSNFPSITFKILHEISRGIIDDVDEKLQDLYCYSIIERYGGNNQYIAVNKTVSDYLDRYKIYLDSDNSVILKKNLIAYLEKLNDDDAFDLTGFVYNVENQIRLNIRGVKSKYLIPSIVLKLIKEEYKLMHDSEVIGLCKRFLETRTSNSFDEVIREIKFWMCQSMARSSNDEFFDWVDEFNGASRHFLLGFYFRYDRKSKNSLDRAQNEYEKALSFREKVSNDDRMKTRIRQELVIILQKKSLFSEALSLSEANYNLYPTNSYYIVAYFRSLVRSKEKRQSVSKLAKLQSELQASLDPLKDAFISVLEGEYEYFINGNFEKSIRILENGIAVNRQKRKSIYSSLLEICKIQEAVPIADNIKKKYHINYDGEL